MELVINEKNISGNYRFIENLTKITLNDVETIEDLAFIGCTNLKEVEINGPLKSIGKYAFKTCRKLQKINLPDTLEEISAYAFENASFPISKLPDCKYGVGVFSKARCNEKIILPDSMQTIPEKMFHRATNIREITGKNIKVVEKYAFCNANIEKFSFDKLVSIGESAFENNKIEELLLPETVETIGKDAFAWSKHLRTVKCQNRLKEIKDGAFYGSDNLEEIIFSENLKTIPDYCISAENIKYIKLPINIKYIGTEFLNSNHGLKEFVFPKTVKTINENFFRNSEFDKIIIPSGVEKIKYSAFYNASVKSLILPNTIKTIGDNVFEGFKGEIFFDGTEKQLKEMLLKNGLCIEIKPLQKTLEQLLEEGKSFKEANKTLNMYKEK